MTDTTRLHWSADLFEPGMYEDPDGDYVHYEDYQALEQQNAALMELLKRWLALDIEFTSTSMETLRGLNDSKHATDMTKVVFDTRRAIARIESAEDVISKWMPIDTAPKFGEVLVYCSDTAEQMVAFHAGGSMWQFAVTPSHKVCCRPTHWMPLPEPPVNSTESAETVHD